MSYPYGSDIQNTVPFKSSCLWKSTFLRVKNTIGERSYLSPGSASSLQVGIVLGWLEWRYVQVWGMLRFSPGEHLTKLLFYRWVDIINFSFGRKKSLAFVNGSITEVSRYCRNSLWSYVRRFILLQYQWIPYSNTMRSIFRKAKGSVMPKLRIKKPDPSQYTYLHYLGHYIIMATWVLTRIDEGLAWTWVGLNWNRKLGNRTLNPPYHKWCQSGFSNAKVQIGRSDWKKGETEE